MGPAARSTPTFARRAAGALIGALMLALTGCASLPDPVARAPSTALTGTGDTRLGRALAPAVVAHPGQTGMFLLSNGRDAFAARVLLARAAERGLDVQYYIWHGDTTGRLLGEALWEAAERGVRVRLLLDDNNTGGLDAAVARLDAHPGIEVRLFNPYANRKRRILELATDFARLNRRMHNKSFTADNQATIVGGRNVGDEYFGAGSPVEFADLDALAVGSAVDAVSASFDAYWNSASAYPAQGLVAPAPPGAPVEPPTAEEAVAAQQYVEAVRATPLVQDLLAGRLPLEWAPAQIVADDPRKVLEPAERTEMHMLPRLERAIGRPVREFDLVSPYFVPTKDGVAALLALAGRGVRVRVLTNSLAATDVLPVHAGYAKHREALLRGGIRLFEMKPRAAEPADRPSREHQGGFGGSSGGSSDTSLHAKTFVADRHRVFIGSFNFDPRSARLNTEMGIVHESPVLAGRIAAALDAGIARIAYEVRLGADGLEWIDGDVVHRSEPGTGPLRQMGLSLLTILPIEWLL
jgi:putative cardiolipin synthase